MSGRPALASLRSDCDPVEVAMQVSVEEGHRWESIDLGLSSFEFQIYALCYPPFEGCFGLLVITDYAGERECVRLDKCGKVIARICARQRRS